MSVCNLQEQHRSSAQALGKQTGAWCCAQSVQSPGLSGQALPAPSASSPGREPSRAPGAASQLAPLPLPPPCLQGKGTPWHCTGCASLLEQCRDRFPPKVALPWRQENGQTPAAPASGRCRVSLPVSPCPASQRSH